MRRHLLSHPTGTTMRIGGEVVSKVVARYDYRCAECLGPLEYWNAGLKCKADKAHTGFVHKKEVADIQAARDAEKAEIETAYKIVNGKLVAKERII